MTYSSRDYPWLDRPYHNGSRTRRDVALMTGEEVAALRGRIGIHSDRTLEQGGLNEEILGNEGLLPAFVHKQRAEVIAYFSRVFHAEDRKAVLAYIPHVSGEVVARTFWLSNSQAAWRYLPGIVGNWFEKGHDEQTLHMPSGLQSTLADISSVGVRMAQPQDGHRAFRGTTRLEGHLVTYSRDVREEGIRLAGNFYGSGKRAMVRPEEMLFEDPAQNADFNHLLTRWTQDTSQYGPVHMEVFPSKNGQFQFTMASDRRGRAWMAGVEVSADYPTSVGVKRIWVDGGCLCTPADEYASQSGGYGPSQNASWGSYVDMYPGYLARVPFIQEYQKSVGQRGFGVISGGVVGAIDSARSFDELYKGLREIGGFDVIIDKVQRVRSGQADLFEITRTSGLRQKVLDLLRK